MNWSRFRELVLEEDAATAVEYAIMLALIIGTAISAISSFGGSTSTGWSKNANIITGAINGAGS